MIPLFKSQYSVGKSLLKIDKIVELAKESNLEELCVLEDNFYGFRELNQKCLEANIKLVFGIKLPVVLDSFEEKTSKLAFFAKNNDGIKEIKNLYTKTYTIKENILNFSEVKTSLNNIRVGVPFYDSFIYNNVFHFGMSDIDLDGVDHFYMIEDNLHPFDFQIKRALEKMKVKNTCLVKTICHENRDDFKAFQMLRAVCGRSQGKTPNFGNPNLNHFCSQEFCWESWKEYHEKA
jgi:hypothetical protein